MEYVSSLSWCRQANGALVAVHKFAPEIIDVISDLELRVFPGGMRVKPLKSWTQHLEQQNTDGVPVPNLLVWRPEGFEIWYRRHKELDFPYDAWNDPAAAAYEKEQLLLPAQNGGDKFKRLREEIIAKAKDCPTAIPLQ